MPNFYSIKLMTRGGGKKKPKWRRRNTMWMATDQPISECNG